MRVKATNIMCKAIRKDIDLESIGITSVTCRRLTIPEYERYVMYAIPRWFTTRDLAAAYRDSDRTYGGFFKALAADLEI